MIPAARAEKCQIHGVEWDGMESSECPCCREADHRRELERTLRAVVAQLDADESPALSGDGGRDPNTNNRGDH